MRVSYPRQQEHWFPSGAFTDYISDVNLTDKGVFTVLDNSGTEILNKVIEYPTAVELVDGYILKITANTGNILLEQNKFINIKNNNYGKSNCD